MNMNLKTVMLTLVAGLALTACSDESVRASKVEDPAPATATSAAPATTVATSELAPTEKQAKPRRTRRAKKDKTTAPADGQRKPTRRRRTRKMDSAEIPVTGMLDSAE